MNASMTTSTASASNLIEEQARIQPTVVLVVRALRRYHLRNLAVDCQQRADDARDEVVYDGAHGAPES